MSNPAYERRNGRDGFRLAAKKTGPAGDLSVAYHRQQRPVGDEAFCVFDRAWSPLEIEDVTPADDKGLILLGF
jgi:hypothetical protein